jgi:hypothetical protein
LKLKKRRFWAHLPDILFHPLPKKPSPQQWAEVIAALNQRTEFGRDCFGCSSQEAKRLWEQATFVLALGILPCFRHMRRKRGSRPLDTATSRFAFSNPHYELAVLIHRELRRAVKIGADCTVLKACERLARSPKKLPKRYAGVEASTLKRLYHAGTKAARCGSLVTPGSHGDCWAIDWTTDIGRQGALTHGELAAWQVQRRSHYAASRGARDYPGNSGANWRGLTGTPASMGGTLLLPSSGVEIRQQRSGLNGYGVQHRDLIRRPSDPLA